MTEETKLIATQKYEYVTVLYTHTSNDGECFDDEENFCGHNTTTKLCEVTLPPQEVGDLLESIGETAADYGDGITDARTIAIFDAFDKTILDRRMFEK